MREIVVLGCGFAGYHAARQLEKELTGRRRVRLTVVTRQAHFAFTPLFPGVASGELEPDNVITAIDEAFQDRTRVIIDDIEAIDLDERQLVGSQHTICFDYLLIATGTVRNHRAFKGADNVPGLDNLDDAVAIRDQLQTHLASGDRPLRFAVVGGSSTGVEWAAELASALRSDHGLSVADKAVEVDLYDSRARLLPDHSEPISEIAHQALDRLGVDCHFNESIQAVEDDVIRLNDDRGRAISMAFHCAGRHGIELWTQSEFELDEAGRIRVDKALTVPQQNGIFVAGDAASSLDDVPDRSNPQIAMQQGRWAARNLLADMSGRMKKNFQFEDRGDFVTLGRNDAAFELRGLILEGRAAWLAYRIYYTALIPRPIQKTQRLMDWLADRIGATESPSTPGLDIDQDRKNGVEKNSTP